MNSHIDVTLEWLTLKLPHLPALGSGAAAGTLGVASFGLLVGGVAPASLVTWMPAILLVSAVAAGYKTVEKRSRRTAARIMPYLALTAVWVFAVGAAAQTYVDAALFETRTSGAAIAIFAGSATLGTALGGRLRQAFETLHRGDGSD